jgi:hypothetical protein
MDVVLRYSERTSHAEEEYKKHYALKPSSVDEITHLEISSMIFSNLLVEGGHPGSPGNPV